MLFQDGALFDSMSVGDNISFPLVHHAPSMSEAERLGPGQCQTGTGGFTGILTDLIIWGQRKVSGLHAHHHGPEVVLFDEPNPDWTPSLPMHDALIQEMKEALGITFIIISHDIVGTVVADTSRCSMVGTSWPSNQLKNSFGSTTPSFVN